MSVISRKNNKIGIIKANALVFSKAQLSAFTGGIVDYAVMISLKEFVGLHYVVAVVYSCMVGAVVNFILNRTWAFAAGDRQYSDTLLKQILKFIPVVINSLVLKAAGTYFFTQYLKLDYKVSRIITDIFVSVLFNFTLQRFWVFKTIRIKR